MNTTTPALSRTWAAFTTYRECSVITGTVTYVVTISRTAQGFTAEVDGLPVSVLEADQILRAADRLELLAEVLPTIGKPAACNLHRELGRLGFKDHYATAADALGRPVPSLAALSAEDAYTVRNYARGQWGMTA
jgi:hypothetical protein